MSHLRRDFFSCAILFFCVLANFFFQVIVLIQIYLAEKEGLPSYLVGLLLSCTGLGGILGAVVSPWILQRRSPATSALACVAMWVPLVWMTAIYQNPIFGLILWGLCSALGAHINVALRTHQARFIGKKYLGRVTGFSRFLSVGAVALGAFSGGWIISALGTGRTAILVSIAFTVPTALLLPLYFGPIRDRLGVQRTRP